MQLETRFDVKLITRRALFLLVIQVNFDVLIEMEFEGEELVTVRTFYGLFGALVGDFFLGIFADMEALEALGYLDILAFMEVQ